MGNIGTSYCGTNYALPNLFRAFADNGWGWPNLELTVAGVTFTFNILGYAVADGGLV